jgi:hypothetical protein
VVEEPQQGRSGQRLLDAGLNVDKRVALEIENPARMLLGRREIADAEPACGAVAQIGRGEQGHLAAPAVLRGVS